MHTEVQVRTGFVHDEVYDATQRCTLTAILNSMFSQTIQFAW